MKYVKNNSGATDTWAGKQLDNAEVYQISHGQEERWRKVANTSGSKIETDVASGDLQVGKDGVAWLSAADGIEYLKRGAAGIFHNDLVMAPADDQVLQYDSGNEKWQCVDPSSLNSLMFYTNWENKDVDGNTGIYFDCGPTSDTWVRFNALMNGEDIGGLIERQSVPIDNFIAGGDDIIVITGDYTSYFKNDNSVRIANSALNDGMYTIRNDSALNTGKTEIKIDGDVPDDAATDGDVLLGDYKVTAAGAGWMEVTLTMSVNANNFNLWVAVFKNNTQIDEMTSLIHPTGSDDNQIFHMKYFLSLAENDMLDIRFKNDQTNKEGWIEYAQLIFRKL